MRKFSNICESIWMDIHRQSTGDAFRKEDQAVIDLMNEFVERHELRGFQYRINGDLTIDILKNISINKIDLIDGKLPFKFKKIEGSMWLTNNLGLETLENAPDEVTGDFVIYQNRFKDFVGGPKIVGGNFSANFNQRLKSLDGSPEKVGGNYSIAFCTSLKDIKGISPEIGGNLEVTDGEKHKVWCDYSDTEYMKYSNIKGKIIRR